MYNNIIIESDRINTLSDKLRKVWLEKYPTHSLGQMLTSLTEFDGIEDSFDYMPYLTTDEYIEQCLDKIQNVDISKIKTSNRKLINIRCNNIIKWYYSNYDIRYIKASFTRSNRKLLHKLKKDLIINRDILDYYVENNILYLNTVHPKVIEYTLYDASLPKYFFKFNKSPKQIDNELYINLFLAISKLLLKDLIIYEIYYDGDIVL